MREGNEPLAVERKEARGERNGMGVSSEDCGDELEQLKRGLKGMKEDEPRRMVARPLAVPIPRPFIAVIE